MNMDKTEILNSYNAARNPKDQIRILADLNQCSVSEILDILNEAGAEVDGRWFKRARRAPGGAGLKQARGEAAATGAGQPLETAVDVPGLVVFTDGELEALNRLLSWSIEHCIGDIKLDVVAVHLLTGVTLRLREELVKMRRAKRNQKESNT